MSGPVALGTATLAWALASLPLAGLALLTARSFGRAAVRYRFLTAAFALNLAVGPLVWLAASVRPPAHGGASAAGVPEPLVAPLAGAAALIAFVLLLELGLDIVRLRRIKQRAVPIGASAVRGAPIGVSRRVISPTAIGYFHPAIVVPDGFRDRVDAAEWRAVLHHECAHLRRYDDWAKALQSVLQRAAWWLPGLWVVGRALDLERELASDDEAAAAAGPRRYAACLLRLASSRAADSAAPALWGHRSQAAIRIERLLRPAAAVSARLRVLGLALSAGLALAIVGAAVLAVPPARTLPGPVLVADAGPPPARLAGPPRAAHLALRTPPCPRAHVARRPAAHPALVVRRSAASVRSLAATAVRVSRVPAQVAYAPPRPRGAAARATGGGPTNGPAPATGSTAAGVDADTGSVSGAGEARTGLHWIQLPPLL
ncbi:MAG: M56 family metallopeptidase [Vulcanimicrobiaceae bacterium]